jgi:basic membrane protein A
MRKNLARGRPAAMLAAVAALTLGSLGSLCATTANAQAPARPPLKIAFVYVSPIGDAGWTYQHEQGRLQMQKALGGQVATTVVEGVAEGADSERVMRDLAASGHGLIFATSFGYLEPALRVAAEFPNVRIEHTGGYKSAPNLKTYNARFYEGRWLAGWLAGRTSPNGVAGYVAGFPVPEVVQGINAFALGMRQANPEAQVKVLWLNTWFDPVREREAGQTLVNQGADVLTNHSASAAVAQTAEDRGVRLLAYQSDMAKFAPRSQLTSVVHQWGGYYTAVAKSVLDGSWNNRPVWGGLKEGMVTMAPLATSVPKAVAADFEAQRLDLLSGKLRPFAGRLVDQQGVQRQAAGSPTLSDEAIAKMDWFVDGVVGSLPGR